jgi:hypothetical protein
MSRINRSLALVLVLSIPCVCLAEVPIQVDCRVPNRPPGRCGWCALETLARHHHIEALYGLSDNHSSMSSAASLESYLEQTDVPYRIQYPGEYEQDILDFAIHEGLGAAVGFRELYLGSGGHIVTLIELTDDVAKVIDSNDQDRRIRTMSRDRFFYWWDGFALVLEPKKPKVLQGTRLAAVAKPSTAAVTEKKGALRH